MKLRSESCIFFEREKWQKLNHEFFYNINIYKTLQEHDLKINQKKKEELINEAKALAAVESVMVVAVFTFLYTWHDFFGPLIYLSERSQYPLSLGLYTFRAQRTTEWALMMAASTLTTLPLVVIFFFTQRYFLDGITLTGIKG